MYIYIQGKSVLLDFFFSHVVELSPTACYHEDEAVNTGLPMLLQPEWKLFDFRETNNPLVQPASLYT